MLESACCCANGFGYLDFIRFNSCFNHEKDKIELSIKVLYLNLPLPADACQDR